MKKAFYIAKEVISWVLLIAMLILFVFTVYQNITNENNGEGSFLFGYRPVLILTGSMEPYMMTNGIILTKAVDDINELAVGDVISYHVESEEGRMLRITHRIVDIVGDLIYTKGDNNNVTDGFPLTMDNVEAKTVAVFNGSAWLINKWQGSTAGKIMIISFSASFILLYFCLKMAFTALIDKIKGKNKSEPQEPVAADIVEAPAEIVPEETPEKQEENETESSEKSE